MTRSSHLSEGRAALAALVLVATGCGGGSGGLGLVSHDKSFVVAGSHKSFDCNQCHSPSAPSFTLAEAGVDCLGCHADSATSPAHASVQGYSWANASCISCHKDGAGGLPANHNVDFFPVTVTGGKHASLGCSACHGATKAIADVTCVPCHTQSAMSTSHAAIPATTNGSRDGIQHVNYQWASAYCLKCHADGQVNRIASHPSFDHGLNGSGHRPFCLTCHATTAPAGGKSWAANFSTYSCLACHSTNNPG